MPDDIEKAAEAVAVDQIILRALLVEVVKRFIEQSKKPDEAKRKILQSLYKSVDTHKIHGVPEQNLEPCREKARRNIDALIACLPPV